MQELGLCIYGEILWDYAQKGVQFARSSQLWNPGTPAHSSSNLERI